MKQTFLMLLMAFLVFACGKTTESNAQGQVAPKDFAEKLSKTPDAILLDVRTPEEFAEGKIKNAQNANYNGPEFEQVCTTLDKNKPVFVYCAGGVRSAKAAARLKELGFTQIVDMQGGFRAWTEQQMPSEKP